MNRAIHDWEAVIQDFNYAVDNDGNPNNDLNNTYTLNISAGQIAGRGVTQNVQIGADDRPFAANITLDDNGGGDGWFFDTTPFDDAEFTAIADIFQASFVDATTLGQQRVNDFYRTITHEIGHALGIFVQGFQLDSGNFPWFNVNGIPVQNPFPANNVDPLLGQLNYVGFDQVANFRLAFDPDGIPNSGDELFTVNEMWEYTLPGGATITFTEDGGGHFYEGPVDPNFAGAAVHLNDLMNPGRTVPPPGADPIPTTRQFISDLNVQILADAYGYTVTLPSDLVVDPDGLDPEDWANWHHTSSAHTTFDSQSGTLLVQGLPGSNDETFTITPDGNQMVVTVSYVAGGQTLNFTSRFYSDQIAKIVIAGNGGTDILDIDEPFNVLVEEVDYVVSSNEDSFTVRSDNPPVADTPGDGLVDLDGNVPGNQVSLRAAIRDANGTSSGSRRGIYIPRGNYLLALTGSGGDTEGDLDIFRHITIVGAGAGATLIDATGLGDRVFEINGSDRSLDLSGVTLTGGSTSSAGGAILVQNAAALTLADSAIVGNTAAQRAGGVRVLDAVATITNSVFTGNESETNGGAVSASGTSELAIGGTVFALNSATTNYPNVEIAGAINNSRNNGYNVLDNTNGSTLFTANLGDHVNAPGGTFRVVTSAVDVFDAGNNATVLSLREAVELSNSGGGTIWLPAWRHRLTRDGVEGTMSQFNDLDVMAAMTIVGVGPGLSVIDASGLRNEDFDAHNRAFDVRGGSTNLNLSRVTVASGLTTGGVAGNAFLVQTGATLSLTDSAVVNHLGMANGVAIRSINSHVSVLRTVFTNNESTTNAVGAIYSSGTGSLTVGHSVFALNTVPNPST